MKNANLHVKRVLKIYKLVLHASNHSSCIFLKIDVSAWMVISGTKNNVKVMK